MGRFASDSGGGTDFKQAPAGTHVARCYSIVDIGTQKGEYLGEPTSRNQIIVRWELPFETEEFEGVQKPLIVSRFYTNSLGEKANLRKDLENWRSKPFTESELKAFDLNSIIGAPCVVSVIHNEKGKAKVTGVGAIPKGTSCPPQFNNKVEFWIDEYNEAVFQSLPKGFQELIVKSDEFKKMLSPGAKHDVQTGHEEGPDDDFPF